MPWEPSDFVRQAEMAPHPKLMGSAVPPVLTELINMLGDGLQWSGASETYASMARDRTATLRKWLLRAQELSSGGKDFEMPAHCARILKGKSMRLMQEMLLEAEYGDSRLPSEIAKGF